MNLTQGIVSLYRKVASSLPPDVEEAMAEARNHETEGSDARKSYESALTIIKECRVQSRTLCLDLGVPFFYVSVPAGIRHADIRKTIVEATREATKKIPLPASAVDPLTNVNSGDNTGEGFPVITIEETDDTKLTVELMLLGTSSENLGRLYSLPDEGLGAGRDLAGVKRCVLDAVERAGGRGCPPYIVGVGIGTTRDQVTRLSKQQLRRKLRDANPDARLAELEAGLMREINASGIGISGSGGATTALGVKIGAHHRHNDSYFVDVTLMCWNTRRGKLIW